MHCYKRYGFKVEDELKSGLKSSCCNNEAVMQMSAIDYHHVSFGFALEMIMLRSGILYTPDCEWSRVQIDCMSTAVNIHNRFYFYFHSFFIIYFVYLVYEFHFK